MESLSNKIVTLEYLKKALEKSKNETDAKFTDISQKIEQIKQIKEGDISKLIGTNQEPIILENLPMGVYFISGNYKLTDEDPNVNLAMHPVLFFTDGEGRIKKINETKVIDYSIVNGNVIENEYVTQEYLKETYATIEYVDSNFIKSKEINTYVSYSMDTVMNDKVAQEVDIDALFL